MPEQSLHVLLVEDSPLDAELLLAELRRAGYEVTHRRVDTADAMQAALTNETWDIVLSDFSMPKFGGMQALALLKATHGENVPFIMVSGTIGEETAVSALKAGAQDFLLKGRLARLIPAIERALRDTADRRERRNLEEQFRHAQKMEAIGRLAGSVAHDFNNMLTAILGYTELLTEQIGPEQSLGRDLREVVAAAQRAAALTRQLLAFSRKQTVALAPTDLTAVVKDVEPMLRRLMGERVALQTVLANDLHHVQADSTQQAQVLMNLAVNARDAMPAGGTLTIETRNVEHDDAFVRTHPDAKTGSFVRVTMRDTGFGMTAAVQAKIFEPFFTTKERGIGTGLGLSAVDGIVKQCGGYIWVESAIGKGTTFHIDWPKTERGLPVARGHAGLAVSEPGKERILLVEDEGSVRQFVKVALQRFGYHVYEASDGKTAAALLEQITEPIQLMISDVVLPDIDGRQLAATIKSCRPEMRVLFMTGYAEWSDNWDETVHGRIELLEKPFTAFTLLKKVRQVLAPLTPSAAGR